MSEKSPHYDLKKKYYELLAADPDYPAWQDFDEKEYSSSCMTYFYGCTKPIVWSEKNQYRYNPPPKKWEPKAGLDRCSVDVTNDFTDEDIDRLQAYATKLSWLREQGGHEIDETHKNNYSMYTDIMQKRKISGSNDFYACDDTIYMNKEQANKWLEMVNNNEV